MCRLLHHQGEYRSANLMEAQIGEICCEKPRDNSISRKKYSEGRTRNGPAFFVDFIIVKERNSFLSKISRYSPKLGLGGEFSFELRTSSS